MQDSRAAACEGTERWVMNLIALGGLDGFRVFRSDQFRRLPCTQKIHNNKKSDCERLSTTKNGTRLFPLFAMKALQDVAKSVVAHPVLPRGSKPRRQHVLVTDAQPVRCGLLLMSSLSGCWVSVCVCVYMWMNQTGHNVQHVC